MDISKHPLIKQAYELCLEIEKLPASPEQTALSVKASNLGEALDRHFSIIMGDFSTINTSGKEAAWPCQSTDAVAIEGCKATTSEIKSS